MVDGSILEQFGDNHFIPLSCPFIREQFGVGVDSKDITDKDDLVDFTAGWCVFRFGDVRVESMDDLGRSEWSTLVQV